MAGSQPTQASVDQALRQCIDPELGIDIVNLGLIYHVEITGPKVAVTMTLTTPGCPLVPYFHQQIVSKVKEIAGAEDVEIVLTFDPPWSPDKMSADGKRQLTMLRS